MYFHRTIEKTIMEAASSFPCVALYGSRQVGKSTTLRMLFPELPHVTLDDERDRALASSNPSLFLDNYGWPLLIDEIDKAPGLLDQLKIRIDRQKFQWMKEDRPCRLMYVISGSNQFLLKRSVSDSLAGRTAVLAMSSFTYAEKIQAGGSPFDPEIGALREKQARAPLEPPTRRRIFQEIFQGGMPDHVVNKVERNLFFRSYVSAYIEKDVRRLLSASSEAAFLNFLSVVALRTAQVANLSDISNILGIDPNTCRRWLSILESSGIVTFLQPYLPNRSNRITKTPKMYFMDTGLCAYLCKWPSAEMLEDCAMSGAFFETYVVGEIVKSLGNSGLDPKRHLYFYRDRDQKEIDLVMEKDGRLFPIEIKKGLNPSKPSKNFKVLSKYGLPVGPGVVLDSCDRIRPLNEEVWLCPASIATL